jgi:hypothetical protein
MLIDQFLPRYDVTARYQIDIQAPIERVYLAARNLDMTDSWIVRWLYRLRRLPKYSLTLDGMLKMGFVLLADQPPQEIVFGLVAVFGRLWVRFNVSLPILSLISTSKDTPKWLGILLLSLVMMGMSK